MIVRKPKQQSARLDLKGKSKATPEGEGGEATIGGMIGATWPCT
jgi:hypothetical protein